MNALKLFIIIASILLSNTYGYSQNEDSIASFELEQVNFEIKVDKVKYKVQNFFSKRLPRIGGARGVYPMRDVKDGVYNFGIRVEQSELQDFIFIKSASFLIDQVDSFNIEQAAYYYILKKKVDGTFEKQYLTVKEKTHISYNSKIIDNVRLVSVIFEPKEVQLEQGDELYFMKEDDPKKMKYSNSTSNISFISSKKHVSYYFDDNTIYPVSVKMRGTKNVVKDLLWTIRLVYHTY